MSARSVWCPTCAADRGQPCVEGGRLLACEHPDRVIAARTEAFAGLTAPKPRRSWWRDVQPDPVAVAGSRWPRK